MIMQTAVTDFEKTANSGVLMSTDQSNVIIIVDARIRGR
jgi:hypothetical protein